MRELSAAISEARMSTACTECNDMLGAVLSACTTTALQQMQMFSDRVRVLINRTVELQHAEHGMRIPQRVHMKDTFRS